MQRARLFYAIWDSSRRAIPFLALIAVLAAALVFGSSPVPAFAQTPPPKPNPVTNLTTQVGDTEVKVSWDAPAAVTECPITKYSLRLYDIANENEDDPGEAVALILKGTTSYVVTELKASTTYDAEVIAYSEADACDTYMSIPVYETFTTNAANMNDDPEKPDGQPKLPPKRPRNLSFSPSGNSLTIEWAAARNGGGRCEHSYYSMYIGAINPFANPTGFPVIRHVVPGRTTTVNGLTSGKYEVYVVSYSLDCKQYSPMVRKVYTHP